MCGQVKKTAKAKSEEPKVFLMLKEDDTFSGRGGYNLVATDKHGEYITSPYILNIGNDGVITRYRGVNEQAGFKLDDGGRVIVKDE